jgi:hypothetical protein
VFAWFSFIAILLSRPAGRRPATADHTCAQCRDPELPAFGRRQRVRIEVDLRNRGRTIGVHRYAPESVERDDVCAGRRKSHGDVRRAFGCGARLDDLAAGDHVGGPASARVERELHAGIAPHRFRAGELQTVQAAFGRRADLTVLEPG